MNNIPFIVIAVLVIIYILASIRREKLSVAASCGWFLFCIGMLFFAIFPYSIDWLSQLMGISYPPTLFLIICIIILFIGNFRDDKKVDQLEKKVTDLAQEINILKGEQNGKK